jgi:hypothetical protein
MLDCENWRFLKNQKRCLNERNDFSMNKIIFTLIALLIVTPSVYARGSGGHSVGHSSSQIGKHSSSDNSSISGRSHSRSHNGRREASSASGAARDSHGRIKRSQKAKSEFEHQHPCPSTGKSRGACAGYVVDHVKPLKRGGADAPSNMQWQTKQAAKQKDKTE